MNYYRELRDEAKQAVATVAANVKSLADQVSTIKKRIQDEIESAGRLEKRIVALKEKAGESLVGSAKNYAKFKQSLSKLGAELETVQELTETFTKELLPAKQDQLVHEQRKLAAALTAFCQSKSPTCEARMTSMIDELVKERDAYLDGLEQIHRDYGASLKRNVPGVIPQCHHDRIDKRSGGLVIAARTPEQRGKAMAALVGAKDKLAN